MLETLLLIALVGCIAHLVSIEKRLKLLEQRMAADAPEASGPGVEPQGPAEAPRVPARIVEPESSLEETFPEEARPASEIREADDAPFAGAAPDEAHAAAQPALAEARGAGFEELFGRKLPIWAGGITLAVAGMLIVKMSIDAGLLSPLVRVIMGLLFGLSLIGGAELALRHEEKVRDVRVRQALSGAGIASLYATVLVASNLYHLASPLMAMLGMALVTALAIGLSLRFGAPCALIGLTGGLAAPALIGSNEPNVPLLSAYLALAVGGLCTVSRGQRWMWLGLSALIGGFGWGLILMFSGALDAPGTISIALYLLLLGVGLPMLGFAGNWQARMQLGGGIMAAAQMAALVATGDFAMLHWALFAMLSLALVWLAARLPELGRLPPVGLTIALLLLGAWPDPEPRDFTLVLSVIALVYGLPALWRLWRANGSIVEAGELAAISIGALMLAIFHFYRADGSLDGLFGLLALGLALIPLSAAALGWRHDRRGEDARFAIVATSGALLAASSSALLLPGWLVGPGLAGIALVLLLLGHAARDGRLEPYGWLIALAGLFACVREEGLGPDLAWQDALQWGLMAALAAAFSWRGQLMRARDAAQFLVPLLLYTAIAPLLSNRFEPLVAPALLLAMTGIGRELRYARWSLLMLVALWAVAPSVQWLGATGLSLLADPVFARELPAIEISLLRLTIPAAVVGLSCWLAGNRLSPSQRRASLLLTGLLATVGLHSLYKLLFAIGTDSDFVRLGLAERTAWQLLLLGAASLAWKVRRRELGLALLGAAAFHFTCYSLLLHNPLLTPQLVGNWPMFNLVTAAYAVPVLVLLCIPRIAELRRLVSKPLEASLWMVMILLFAATMLRQLFHGELLVTPGLSQMEDIARSILAIALAVGFLLWGIRHQDRNWRIGSLILMVGAVAKVFLWDTSGLEGLVRIASFVALGFSLIGIGWLYSRQLAPSRA